jgi:hypothetical protein
MSALDVYDETFFYLIGLLHNTQYESFVRQYFLENREKIMFCPTCYHNHLGYLDDEGCISCGCWGAPMMHLPGGENLSLCGATIPDICERCMDIDTELIK